MPDAVVNFSGGATVVIAGTELLEPFLDTASASADRAANIAAELAGMTGAILPRRDVVFVGIGDSHLNGRLQPAAAADGSASTIGLSPLPSPRDFTWGGTGRDPVFKNVAAINSVTTPNASNDQGFTQVSTDMASWIGFVPPMLRAAYPSIGDITIANVAAGGSSAYTWAGEQAYGYVGAFAQATAGDTVTIAGQVYTFRAAPAANYDVQIGASANESIRNLQNAVNGEGVGFFAGTPRNAKVWGATPASTQFGRFVAIETGVAGNAIVVASSTTARISATTPALAPVANAPMTGGSDTSALYANAKAKLAGGAGLTLTVAFVSLGTNDANRPGYRGRGTQAELTKLFARFHADFPTAKLIIHRPPVIGTGQASSDALANTVIPAIDAVVAANVSFASSVDVYGLGAGPDGQGKLLNVNDGIHMTPVGYVAIAQLNTRKAASVLGL
jgi:lysophospholipase L1-like esterase